MTSSTTYLIDNCGEVINQWEASARPGLSAYLLPNGDLLRTRQTNNANFVAGGSSGGVDRFSWDGSLMWEYEISSSTECHHHDIEYLPNGNILMIAWETVPQADVIQAGRNPNITPEEFWPDKIVEINPNGSNGGTVVWEWHSMDHLIQSFDASKDNYGVLSEHPELIDINYPADIDSDWLHINSVDYNPVLDQIILSVHGFSELWIIDHSTTTAEAGGHSGGNSGKGGDILYRWGNPQVYGHGNVNDRKFFKQHDARWITEGADAGKIMVFNNGKNRTPNDSYSTVDIIEQPVDQVGNYTQPIETGGFLPNDLFWSYQSDPTSAFYSANISGAHRLPNNNTIICEGASGHLFEVNEAGDLVWEYVNPVDMNGPLDQGTTSTQGVGIFRCERYSPDYSAFAGRDLTPSGVIELNSTFSCNLYTNTSGVEENLQENIRLIADYSAKTLFLSKVSPESMLTVFDAFGRLIHQQNVNMTDVILSTESWPSGIYFVRVDSELQKRTAKVLIN